MSTALGTTLETGLVHGEVLLSHRFKMPSLISTAPSKIFLEAQSRFSLQNSSLMCTYTHTHSNTLDISNPKSIKKHPASLITEKAEL